MKFVQTSIVHSLPGITPKVTQAGTFSLLTRLLTHFMLLEAAQIWLSERGFVVDWVGVGRCGGVVSGWQASRQMAVRTASRAGQ